MFFTVFYMYATIMQWWRLRILRDKLNGTLTNQNALIVTTEPSNFRQNQNNHRSLENLLFRYDDRIGCTVVPKQKLNLSQWLAFPRNLRHFPIYIEDNSPKIHQNESVFILVQAVLDRFVKHESEMIQVENFGELIGWRVTDYFELVLRTNIDNLTKLVMKFSRTDLDMNHDLHLVKIESIDIEGTATSIKYEKKYLKEQTIKYSYAPKHWQKFVDEIKELYAKIRDSTNPKIKIENGTTKSVENPVVAKKQTNCCERADKHTLDVTSGDHRRHKYADKTKTKDSSNKKCRSSKTINSEGKRDTELPTSTEDSSEIKPKSTDEESKVKSKIADERTKVKSKSGARINKNLDETSTISNKTPDTSTAASDAQSNIRKETGRHLNRVASKPGLNRATPIDEETIADDLKENCTTKPPNVLVYADSIITRDNVKKVLYSILNKETYTIYDLPTTTKIPWNSSTVLVVVCGSVPPNLTTILMQYLLNGGQLFCLCSDLMYSILHTFTTAEVREHELVRFSYGNWERVKMMHHIFCYQASPAKKQFSKDSDQQSNHSSGSTGSTSSTSPLAPRTPSNVELKLNDQHYNIQIQVLGTEETWQTPSLLLANVQNTRGRAVFSQVHLEIDPEQYENDETKYESLKSSNEARLEILKDLLTKHLDMICDGNGKQVEYTPGYFLGQYHLKTDMLTNCPNIVNNQLHCDKINVVFCGNNVDPGLTTNTRLPVMLHSCPSNFSTLEYFETLATERIGRLVIYADILTSSQYLLSKQLCHGLVVIPRQQTNSYGRSNNIWLSPLGSAAFSLQLHIPLSTILGQNLSLIQHMMSTAIIVAIKKQPGYQDLKIGIKWPNDIYADGNTKIGGAIVNTAIQGDQAIVNYGAALNLSNRKPTICLHDLIERENRVNKTNLNLLSYERYFAVVFNEIEKLYTQTQANGIDDFLDLYYQHWLHDYAKITIQTEDDASNKATIIGIDKYGYLRVRLIDGSLKSVQPDGNSFDMMRGLIIPKVF